MMGETDGRTLEVGDHVDVIGLGGERHGQGGESGFAIEASASEAGAGEKVGERFQAVEFKEPSRGPQTALTV